MLQVVCGTMGLPTATVRLRGPDGQESTGVGMGTGPIDASYKAIDSIVNVQVSSCGQLVLQHSIKMICAPCIGGNAMSMTAEGCFVTCKASLRPVQQLPDQKVSKPPSIWALQGQGMMGCERKKRGGGGRWSCAA